MSDYKIGDISMSVLYDLTHNYEDRLLSFVHSCLSEIHDKDSTSYSLAELGFHYDVKTGLVVCDWCRMWACAFADLYVVKSSEYHFFVCRNVTRIKPWQNI